MESVGRLAGGISHDISNLLTPILGYSEFLQGDGEGRTGGGPGHPWRCQAHPRPDAQAPCLRRMQRLAKSVVDLRVVVRDFQVFLRRTIATTVEIRVECAEDVGLVTVDVGQVEQVLMNLAINAQDAMPPAGSHFFPSDRRPGRGVDAQSPGSKRRLRFPDGGRHGYRDGRGHAEACFRAVLHDQGDGKRNRPGLSTVYGIVNQHDGYIDVDSSRVWGTVLRSTFPGLIARSLAFDAPFNRFVEGLQ